MRKRALVALAVLVAALVYGTLTFIVFRSLGHAKHDIAKRPNCALVDDAVRSGRAPDRKVVAACESSARGLIYSLTPEDLAALRSRRPSK